MSKRYDLLVGQESGDKIYWHKIGTIFCDDKSTIKGQNGKSPSFVINYPKTTGIVKPASPKEQTT